MAIFSWMQLDFLNNIKNFFCLTPIVETLLKWNYLYFYNVFKKMNNYCTFLKGTESLLFMMHFLNIYKGKYINILGVILCTCIGQYKEFSYQCNIIFILKLLILYFYGVWWMVYYLLWVIVNVISLIIYKQRKY